MKAAPGVLFGALFEDKIDTLRFRRPQTEMRFGWADQFRADRVAARLPGKAGRSAFALRFAQSDFSFHPKSDNKHADGRQVNTIAASLCRGGERNVTPSWHGDRAPWLQREIFFSVFF